MNTTTHNKPLGFWLAVVEHRTRNAMREAFADQAVSRREWRILNVVAQSPVTAEELSAAMPPRGRAGKGYGGHDDSGHGDLAAHDRHDRHDLRRPVRRTTAEVVDALVGRGWLASDDGKLSVTDEGSRMMSGFGQRVASVRAKTGAGISDVDYATTIDTLKAMAVNLGWTEDSARPHRGRRGWVPLQ